MKWVCKRLCVAIEQQLSTSVQHITRYVLSLILQAQHCECLIQMLSHTWTFDLKIITYYIYLFIYIMYVYSSMMHLSQADSQISNISCWSISPRISTYLLLINEKLGMRLLYSTWNVSSEVWYETSVFRIDSHHCLHLLDRPEHLDWFVTSPVQSLSLCSLLL